VLDAIISSLRCDVRLANGATACIVIFARTKFVISAASSDRIKPLCNKLRLDVACLRCSRKPAGELRECVFRRLRLDQAHKAMVRLRAIDPTLRVSDLRQMVPFRRPEDLARFEEGLRKAGLPE
jgi:hypothetical protein